MSNSSQSTISRPGGGHHPRFLAVALAFLVSGLTTPLIAAQQPDEASPIVKCSPTRILESLREFTREPHPFGSSAQTNYAEGLRRVFSSLGWKASLQKFYTITPSNTALLSLKKKEKKALKREVQGTNVIATRKGNNRCALLLGGHFDTKFFPNFRFVGANDGGSSTALLLELARILPEQKFKMNSYGACSLHIVLFDGEEAVLPDWGDGERVAGIVDHLYGSRHFVTHSITSVGKSRAIEGSELILAFIVDMIGHKNQQLSITQGSSPKAAATLLAVRQSVPIVPSSEYVEDDHLPFMALEIPVLHLIDWTNLKEWHTAQDTLEMVSPEKIALFGDAIIRFLQSDRT